MRSLSPDHINLAIRVQPLTLRLSAATRGPILCARSINHPLSGVVISSITGKAFSRKAIVSPPSQPSGKPTKCRLLRLLSSMSSTFSRRASSSDLAAGGLAFHLASASSRKPSLPSTSPILVMSVDNFSSIDDVALRISPRLCSSLDICFKTVKMFAMSSATFPVRLSVSSLRCVDELALASLLVLAQPPATCLVTGRPALFCVPDMIVKDVTCRLTSV